MTNMKTKQILAALALVAAASSTAVAQTDFGSSLGAGAGLGASVAPLGVPGGPDASPGLPTTGAQGLANARAAFMNATGGGVSVPNPAGGTVTVPQAAAQALGAVLGGNATPAQVNTLSAALGVSGSAASLLVQALQSLGGSVTTVNLSRAIAAYNAAVDATPAGSNPSPTLLAVRQALAAGSR